MSQFGSGSAGILEAVQAGVSIEESARTAGVPVATVRRWLREGRKGKSTYAAWAEEMDKARADRRVAERALDGPLSEEEAELLLARAARKGSVAALRIFFERLDAAASSNRGDAARELLAGVFNDN